VSQCLGCFTSRKGSLLPWRSPHRGPGGQERQSDGRAPLSSPRVLPTFRSTSASRRARSQIIQRFSAATGGPGSSTVPARNRRGSHPGQCRPTGDPGAARAAMAARGTARTRLPPTWATAGATRKRSGRERDLGSSRFGRPLVNPKPDGGRIRLGSPLRTETAAAATPDRTGNWSAARIQQTLIRRRVPPARLRAVVSLVAAGTTGQRRLAPRPGRRLGQFPDVPGIDLRGRSHVLDDLLISPTHVGCEGGTRPPRPRP
jgi:hypothetical protein